MNFRDILYGEITLPDWIAPFLRIPEFARLRGVRLSNVDSLQYKDFGSATRYDHAIGVVHLALRVATLRRLSQMETAHLALAALLHDVGTPPFGHTLEIVFDDVDHELEAWNALGLDPRGQGYGFNAFDGELPQFVRRCASVSSSLGLQIKPEAVGELINGQGELGFLIKGSIDLDNTDNVLRGAHYMGLQTSATEVENIVDWIATLDKQPLLEGELPDAVKRWIQVRDEYYRLFYDCNEDEQGRQALLQFIIRESFRLGMPKERMLKTTDSGLILAISDFAREEGTRAEYLTDAVRKYKHLDPVEKVTDIDIEEKSILDAFRVRSSISWIEHDLRHTGFIPMLFFAKRRFPETMKPANSLFGYPAGRLSIFTLYDPYHGSTGKKSHRLVPPQNELHTKVVKYSYSKPWRAVTDYAQRNICQSLKSWGDWAFLGSQNDSLHTYPSTFVHAIPSAFIKSLGLAGETIFDPFCGSGITGTEGAKSGCPVLCADINEVALLISRVRTTYLSKEIRERLWGIDTNCLTEATPVDVPKLDNLHKWHHPRTVEQLTHILSFANSVDCPSERGFLRLCFSAILTATTARRGKEHSWFADNTPLSRGEEAPPYIDAFPLFLAKIQRNLRVVETFYSVITRGGENPEEALSRISVIRADATAAASDIQCHIPNGIGGIITSPPYLCMADYSLGQRLSYAWLFPDYLQRDFNDEMGARRRRTNPEKADQDYKHGMTKFAELCKNTVRQDGFVALVLGEPKARDFQETNILEFVRETFKSLEFRILWENWRPISWNRNQGHLKKERLIVFVKK